MLRYALTHVAKYTNSCRGIHYLMLLNILTQISVFTNSQKLTHEFIPRCMQFVMLYILIHALVSLLFYCVDHWFVACVKWCSNNFAHILLRYFSHSFLFLLALNVICVVPSLSVLNKLNGVKWMYVNLLPRLPSFFRKSKAFKDSKLIKFLKRIGVYVKGW